MSRINAIAHKESQIIGMTEKMKHSDDEQYIENCTARISLLEDMIRLLQGEEKPKEEKSKKRSNKKKRSSD